jgi:hypothetical protein
MPAARLDIPDNMSMAVVADQAQLSAETGMKMPRLGLKQTLKLSFLRTFLLSLLAFLRTLER